MTQKSIICNSYIEAESLRALLMEKGITCVSYDETNSKVARGILDTTVQVMVREEDYDEAMEAYNEMVRGQEGQMPWCPRCGSDNVEPEGGGAGETQGTASPTGAASGTARKLKRTLLSILRPILLGYSRKYVCRDCGHRFRR